MFRIDFDEADETVPEAARNTVKYLRANEPLVRLKIAALMCELYTEWNDGKVITPEELAQMITLTDVEVSDEGGGELFYDAANIFAGHSIWASIDANGEVGEPDLAG